MRVLVVEDEPVIALNIQTILLDLGCRPVGPAGTIAQARALIADRKIDAAILDVALPDGDCFELAGELIGRGMPVLLATGQYLDNLPEQLAMTPRLFKPFDIAALEVHIAEMKAKVGLLTAVRNTGRQRASHRPI